jgi:hypothetical protein
MYGHYRDLLPDVCNTLEREVCSKIEHDNRMIYGKLVSQLGMKINKAKK